MATVVEFNNALLADAIKRANIVAPTRGRELDKFKGFVFDLYPGEEYVTLRTTNGELYYMEYLYPLNIEVDEPVSWRVASSSTHGIVSNLPTNGTVKVKDEGGKIRLTSGRMKASTPLIRSDDYPDIDHFMYEPENMFEMKGFGVRLDLVGWSTSADNMPPRCGVYMDEEWLCATNGKTLARVPNDFKFADGRDNIVMPYALVAPIVRTMEELQVGVLGNHIIISPTEDIYIKCTLYEPRFDPVNRIMDREHEESLVFDKEQMLGILSRVSKIGSADRLAGLDVYIVNEMMVLSIKDEQSSEEIEESAMLISGGDHDLAKFLFSIEYFTDIVAKAPGKEITMHYNPSKPGSMVRFSADQGYEGCVMPRLQERKAREEE